MSGLITATVVTGVYAANKADKANKRSVNAAMDAAQLERETALDTLNYYKERDAQSFALQGQANAIAGRVANAQVSLMNQQRQQSAEYFNRLKAVFWPVEDRLVKDAEAYDTPERREYEASKAAGDVGAQYGIAREANVRNMTRMGVNPNSGKFQLANNQMSLAEAGSRASAANAARDTVEQQGWARRYDAAALGRNLPTNSAQSASASTQAGSAAVSAAYAPVTAFNNQTQLMGQAMNNYGNSLSNANSLLVNAHNNQAQMWGNAAGGFGNLAGSALGILSAQRTAPTAATLASTGSTAAMAPASYSLAGQGAKLSAW